MNPALIVAAGGVKMGSIEKDARGRLRFVYDDDWRAARAAFPLSLSMPLTAAEHGHRAVESYLWGLLPDNELVLDAWAKTFQVSARDAFALISNVGEDCAGAAQFVKPERAADFFRQRKPRIEWLSEADVAARLRELRHNPAAWRTLRDTGYFSLAGAQAKTALFFDGERWGVPSGRTPTTHILKPPTHTFDGHAENELFCLRLARRLGIPAADAEVMTFKGETAIVVERYDRVRLDDTVVRVHQEDVCQALSLPPTKKYENDGGPGVRATADLIRDVSSARVDDLATFLGAIIFNWLIAGTDAHAKNYSLLIGAGGRVRLAPLYDVASALPYDALNQHKLKSAMKIGGEYLLKNVGVRQWRKLAAETKLDEGAVIDQARRMARAMPDEADAERRALKAADLPHPIVARLADRLAVRARRLEKLFG